MQAAAYNGARTVLQVDTIWSSLGNVHLILDTNLGIPKFTLEDANKYLTTFTYLNKLTLN